VEAERGGAGTADVAVRMTDLKVALQTIQVVLSEGFLLVLPRGRVLVASEIRDV